MALNLNATVKATNGGTIKLRKYASGGDTVVLANIPSNTRVEATWYGPSDGTNWYAVKWSTYSGYMMAEFVFPDGSSNPGGSTTYTLLKNGSSGQLVKDLQNKLVSLKYCIGTTGPDGQFGKSTEQAVKWFQRRNNLTCDGQAGTNTQTVLYGSSPVTGVSGSPMLYNRADTAWTGETYGSSTLGTLWGSAPAIMAMFVSTRKGIAYTPYFVKDDSKYVSSRGTYPCGTDWSYFSSKAGAYGYTSSDIDGLDDLTVRTRVEGALTAGKMIVFEFNDNAMGASGHNLLLGYQLNGLYITCATPTGSTISVASVYLAAINPTWRRAKILG